MTKFILFVLAVALLISAGTMLTGKATIERHPTAAETVLLIGDSHSVMSFGETLAKKVPGLSRYAVAGSAANDWLQDKICPDPKTCLLSFGYATPGGFSPGMPPTDYPGIKEILAGSRAPTIVFALGTNDASQRCRQPSSLALAPVIDLLKFASGRKCYWVGPPTYTTGPIIRDCGTDYRKFVDALEKTVEEHSCTFIDSRALIDPETNRPIETNIGDEIHFDERLGEFWADQVRAALAK